MRVRVTVRIFVPGVDSLPQAAGGAEISTFNLASILIREM